MLIAFQQLATVFFGMHTFRLSSSPEPKRNEGEFVITS